MKLRSILTPFPLSNEVGERKGSEDLLHLATAAALLFVAFTIVIATHVLDGLDWALLLRVQPLGDEQVERGLSLFSYFASAEVSVAVAGIWALALWRAGYRWAAVAPWLFVLSVPVEFWLKLTLHHPSVPEDFFRPGLGYGLLSLTTVNSYPSGHATRAFFFGVLAWLQAGQLSGAARRPIRVGIVLVEAAMAANRVYLGIHWPTDVAGGWLLGFTLAVLAWSALFLLPRHRRGRNVRDRPGRPTRCCRRGGHCR